MNQIDRNFLSGSIPKPEGSPEAQHKALRAELMVFAEGVAVEVRNKLETRIVDATKEALVALEAGLSKNIEHLGIVKEEEAQDKDVRHLVQIINFSLADAMKNAKQIITNRLSNP